jgi:hypothetical protein
MDGNDDSQTYFAAGRPNLGVELAGLELLRQLIFGKKQRQPIPRPNMIPNFQGAPQMIQPRFDYQQPAIPLKQIPGQVPNQQFGPPKFQMRLAGERDDLLRDIDNTIYGGGNVPAPTPTPTPRTGTPRLASANSNQTDQWYSNMVHSYFQRPPSLDPRYNPDPESGQFRPSLVPQRRAPGVPIRFDPDSLQFLT